MWNRGINVTSFVSSLNVNASYSTGADKAEDIIKTRLLDTLTPNSLLPGTFKTTSKDTLILSSPGIPINATNETRIIPSLMKTFSYSTGANVRARLLDSITPGSISKEAFKTTSTDTLILSSPSGIPIGTRILASLNVNF